MNKIWKGLLLVVLVLTLSCNVLPLGAQNGGGGVAPQGLVSNYSYVTLSVTGTTMRAKVEYDTGLNLTLAEVLTYIQKYEGSTWKPASTTATCSWVDKSTKDNNTLYHYFTLTASGSYRVKCVFYFYGTGGDEERIEKYDYYNYHKT